MRDYTVHAIEYEPTGPTTPMLTPARDTYVMTPDGLCIVEHVVMQNGRPMLSVRRVDDGQVFVHPASACHLTGGR